MENDIPINKIECLPEIDWKKIKLLKFIDETFHGLQIKPIKLHQSWDEENNENIFEIRDIQSAIRLALHTESGKKTLCIGEYIIIKE